MHQAHPDDFWAALTLARALQEGGDHKAADAAYLWALELRGDSAAVYNNLGNMSTSKGRWDEAADYFRKSLEIDPNFAPAHNNLGLALKGQGKWSEAFQQFQEAIRFGPELAPPHYNLGELRAYQGGLDEAIAQYRQRYGSTPSSAGPSTCSASRWPPGAGWTKQTTAISGLSATTPYGPRPKRRPALSRWTGDHPLPARPRDRPGAPLSATALASPRETRTG